MKAIVWHGPGRMAIEERPEPKDPGAGELVVRPEAVGICGSEVEGYLGHMGNRTPPLVMGHEFAGVVVAAGAGAGAWEGARVTVNPLAGCGQLPAVRRRTGEPVPAAHPDRRPPRRRLRRPRHRPGGQRARAARRRHARASARSSSRWPTACTRCAWGWPATRWRERWCSAPGRSASMTLQAALLSGIEHVERARAADAAARARARARRARGLRRRRRGARGRARGDRRARRRPRPRRRRRTGDAGAWRSSSCAPARRRCTSASPPTTPRSASTGSCAASSGCAAPTPTRWPTSSRRSRGWPTGARRVGELPAVQPLDDGPDAFARLAEGPPPATVKVFLAGAGRDA